MNHVLVAIGDNQGDIYYLANIEVTSHLSTFTIHSGDIQSALELLGIAFRRRAFHLKLC